MAEPIKIRMGGYGPPTTSFSRSLKLTGDTLSARFGDRVNVHYVWNIMEFGYRAEEILSLVEDGILTRGYQSPSSALSICRFCSSTAIRRARRSTVRSAAFSLARSRRG